MGVVFLILWYAAAGVALLCSVCGNDCRMISGQFRQRSVYCEDLFALLAVITIFDAELADPSV